MSHNRAFGSSQVKEKMTYDSIGGGQERYCASAHTCSPRCGVDMITSKGIKQWEAYCMESLP